MSHPSAATLSESEVAVPAGHGLRRAAGVVFVLGAICLAASILWGFGEDSVRARFFPAYLTAYAYFLSLSLGALVFVLIQWVTKAGWSVTVRRLAENAMGVMPLLVVLFVPLLFGLHELFHWTHADAVAHDPMLTQKAPYLNVTFFLVRAAIYFVAWTALALWFRAQSVRQDSTGDHALTRRMQLVSGPAIFAYAFTVTFAAFDWLMSLDPHWYSTIFGGYFFAGSLMSALSLMAVVLVLLKGAGFLGAGLTREHLHDVGKLTFAFVIFWAYLAFSQFMLIWYANIPEETAFFKERLAGDWRGVSVALLVGHFALPFFYLMSRHVKRLPALLLLGSVYLLVLHFVDVFWLVQPAFQPGDPHFGALELTCVLGVGGTWLGAFLWLVTRVRLVPVRDPRLPEALAFENF